MNISDFHPGESYTNQEIVEAFKCGNMGGMRRSKQTNTLVIFVKHGQCYHADEWHNGILNYTGMGKIGDQCIDYSQNKTLAEAHDNHIALHLFESYEPSIYNYSGEVELASAPFTAQEPDANGNERTVIKFPLRLKDSKANA